MTTQHAVVIGGSRGLGRGVVEALAARGVQVRAIARDRAELDTLSREVTGVTTVAGDATNPELAARTIAEQPDLIVVVAGAKPVLGPIHQLSWSDFNTNWEVDTRATFTWLGQALRAPLHAGAHVIVVSSGAAIGGSPVSGGYASAKRAQWFIADYAANESKRSDLGVRVHCVLPNLNGSTELGRAGIAAYAARAGITADEFAKRFDPPLTPAIMGASIVELFTAPDRFPQLVYRLGGSGLAPLS